MNIGIIGCGNISDTYFDSQSIFKNIKITACADIIQDLSDKKASEYNVKSFTVDDLFKNKDIDIVLNLTVPSAHKEIIIKSLENGKHCFSEKPLAINFKEGLEIKKISKEKKLTIGCAPDTFLGAAGQKARSIIENQDIGKIVLGTFNIMSHGMEDWHPNPDFFFKPGAGPIFDIGVYYITQLVNLLGPVKQINSLSMTVQNERIITSQPRYGEKIFVETPTTLMGVLEFYNNAKVQFFCSWDVWNHSHSNMELYGTGGSMIIPDPNFFSGDIMLAKENSSWNKINNDKMLLGIPNKIDNNGDKIANYRGIGLSEMIESINNNRFSRCNLDLSLHVLEVMEGILIAAETQKIYLTQSNCNQPKVLSDEDISKLMK